MGVISASAGFGQLERRFEAIVLVGEISLYHLASGLIGALRRAGVCVAAIADADIGDLVKLAGDDGPAVGALLLGDGRGVDVAECTTGPLRAFARRHADHGALDRATEELSARLADRGLATTIVPRRAVSPVATVELVADAVADEQPLSVPEVLLAHGMSGSSALVDLGSSAAQHAGLDAARVTVTPGRIEIALAHQQDVLAWACASLWALGIGAPDVLVLRPPASTGEDLDQLLDPVFDGVTFVAVDELQATGVLEDQLRRRGERNLPGAVPEAGWALVREGFDPEREPVDEARLALADGRIGSSGAPLLAHPSTRRWVIVGDVYVGEGPDTRLLTAPSGACVAGELVAGDRVRRVLDLRTGVLHEDVIGDGRSVRGARFSSLARPGTVVMRAVSSAPLGPGARLLAPTDDPVIDGGADEGVGWMRVAAGTEGVAAATLAERRDTQNGEVLDRFVAYEVADGTPPSIEKASDKVRHAAEAGFDQLLTEHRRAWARRWEDADIEVDGDGDLQQAIRFALFHLMASVPDCGEAAVGARGLSGTSYRGHVFWDADTFVLPFLAATHPAAARAMLEYRIRRMPAALEAARDAGRAGARFPWESARSGRDVTPVSARDRSGRLIPIRTGLLEDHIVAEVAWAAKCYVEWSGDDDFARGPGLGLLVETARYWASRMRQEFDGSAHIYGVIGPDEYHEPVDDNAFTNVMARWNLRRAAAATDAYGDLDGRVGAGEVDRWRELADAVVDGWDPHTGVYEQFAGFRKLESLIIAEVAPRRPIAADLLLGAERVRRAQVLKQADVLMLHHLVPDEVMPDTLDANLRYYEPRTAHGSSLSPSIHASLFARARDFDRALEALHIGSRIDLDDLTGSTAGGLHLATMGGLWQALAFGFCGLRPAAGRLRVSPRLPPAWSRLDLRVRFRGARVRVRTERTMLTIEADAPTPVVVDGTEHTAGPASLTFDRRGAKWRVTK